MATSIPIIVIAINLIVSDPMEKSSQLHALSWSLSRCSAANCSNSDPDKAYACLMSLTTEQVAKALPWKQWRNEHYRELPEVDESSAALLTVNGEKVVTLYQQIVAPEFISLLSVNV